MGLSRRRMLKRAAAAGGAVLAPQVVTAQAPAQLTGTQTGRKFKAFVRHGTGASVQELKLLAIQPRGFWSRLFHRRAELLAVVRTVRGLP